jgi:hypothetical protein
VSLPSVLNNKKFNFYANIMPDGVQVQIFLFNSSRILKAFTAARK